MPPDEGVIKFSLEHTPAPPLPEAEIEELNRWRDWMVERGLLGVLQTPSGPLGFGNISRRVENGFIITGSQTGGLPRLGPEHYTLVRECLLAANRVRSEGPIPPSSESLTHAAVYRQDPAIKWVFHAHCQPIWRQAARLDIPSTASSVPYGTPQMAAEVSRLFQEKDLRGLGIFAMGGHPDGIVTFGAAAEAAAHTIEEKFALIESSKLQPPDQTFV